MSKCPECGAVMWFVELLGHENFEENGERYQLDASLWYCDHCRRGVLVIRLFKREERLIRTVRTWSWVMTRELEPHPGYTPVEVVKPCLR